jgi:hypothetical protein
LKGSVEDSMLNALVSGSHFVCIRMQVGKHLGGDHELINVGPRPLSLSVVTVFIPIRLCLGRLDQSALSVVYC